MTDTVIFDGDWMTCGGCANGVIEHDCKLDRARQAKDPRQP